MAVDMLDEWCRRWLGAPLECELFTSGHLSRVVGLRLRDGREVVVKIRPASGRAAACTAVQRTLWHAGFPCPEPLIGPVPFANLMANAEVHVPGGDLLPVAGDAVDRYAELLARLVSLATGSLARAPNPALSPNPAWVAWDHGGDGIWPVPDDRDADLNAHPESGWLDEIGARVQARLRRLDHARIVVGHGDWEAQNLRWRGTQPLVVHDWDSVVAAAEPVVVGVAASVWPCGAQPRAATVAESAAFVRAYIRASGRMWSTDEVEASWAAGLWVYAFNTKKATLDGIPWLRPEEAAQRLELAGA